MSRRVMYSFGEIARQQTLVFCFYTYICRLTNQLTSTLLLSTSYLLPSTPYSLLPTSYELLHFFAILLAYVSTPTSIPLIYMQQTACYTTYTTVETELSFYVNLVYCTRRAVVRLHVTSDKVNSR